MIISYAYWIKFIIWGSATKYDDQLFLLNSDKQLLLLNETYSLDTRFHGLFHVSIGIIHISLRIVIPNTIYVLFIFKKLFL